MPELLFNRFVGSLVLALLAAAGSRLANAEPPADLYRAYYLENSVRDYAAARAIYDRIVDDRRADSQVRDQARRRAERCRDELAADNMASLVPPNVLGYVELRKPLALVASLAESVGLAGHDVRAALAQRPDGDATLPFNIPKQITLSPALVDALSAFGGAAVAITGMDNPQQPSGLLIVHHGNDRLLKGLLETGFQFAPTARKIADMPTFGFQDRVVGVLSEALLIVGTSRTLVEEAVARLDGRETTSLASREDLRDVNARRAGATLFAYVDGPACVEQVRQHALEGEHARREFAQANAFVDLDHFRWATFAFGVRDRTISADLTIRLADDHRNLVFDLLRLPAMNRRTFAFVPADCAGVAGIGLNPAIPAIERPVDREGGGERVRISGLDVLRELFGNIQEATAFVVPGGGTTPSKKNGGGGAERIPDAGLVIASNDIRKSAALWGRLLSLPGLAEGGSTAEPKSLEVAGTAARGYEIPGVGTVYLAELDGCLVVTTTKNAMRQSIRAHERKNTIETDAVMQAALKKVPSDSSILLVVNGGRCAAIAASQASMGERMPLNMAAGALKETVLWFGLGQSPAQLSLRVGLTGLPDVNELIQTVRPLATAAIQQAVPQPARKEAKRRHRAAESEE